jgi:putative transposase
VLVSFVYVLACRLFALVLLLTRSDGSNELELLVPRHELSILRRQARRSRLAKRSTGAGGAEPGDSSSLVASVHRHARDAAALARRIVAGRWTYPHRRPGRPPVDQEVRQLILRLARENSHWGYVRIVGELRKLGITVSATLGAQPAHACRHPTRLGARRLQLAVVRALTRTHDPRL